MDKAILNWIKSSKYDVATAEALLESKRYIYVIFFCHLSVEKLLKAVVCKITGKTPPKTHDLFLLIKLANISLPEKQQLLVAHLNTVSIPTRYPQDISRIAKQYNSAAGRNYLKETKSFVKWLKQNQRLTD